MAELLVRPILALDTKTANHDDDCNGKPWTQCETCQRSLKCITSPRTLSKHGMISRSTTASAARLQVFNTAELLENILSHLSDTDLLVTRRVTIYWNALIITSHLLRIKLFLKPDTAQTTWIIEDLPTSTTVQLPNSPKNKEPTYLTWPAKLNPLLFTTAPAHVRKSLHDRVQFAEKIYFLAPPDLSRRDTIHLSMLLCQPSTKQLTIDIEFRIVSTKDNKKKNHSYQPYHLRGRPIQRAVHVHRKVENANGVTFGDVLKALRAGVRAKGFFHGKGDGWKVAVRAGGCSWVRMSGVVFATAKEREMVGRGLM